MAHGWMVSHQCLAARLPAACPAGKVTPEAAADLKMGLMGMKHTNRWVVYSTLKPLYDVSSWDKLVEVLNNAVLKPKAP